MKTPQSKALGAFVVARIAERKTSIPRVAKKTGLALSVVQRVCSGESDPQLSTIKKLCGALHFRLVIHPGLPPQCPGRLVLQ